MFSPIISIQGNDIISATKAIDRNTHSGEIYYNYSGGNYKDYNRFYYTTEKMSNITVASMNCQREGFH